MFICRISGRVSLSSAGRLTNMAISPIAAPMTSPTGPDAISAIPPPPQRFAAIIATIISSSTSIRGISGIGRLSRIGKELVVTMAWRICKRCTSTPYCSQRRLRSRCTSIRMLSSHGETTSDSAALHSGDISSDSARFWHASSMSPSVAVSPCRHFRYSGTSTLSVS